MIVVTRLNRSPLPADVATADIRIGYARCSTVTQELQSQLDSVWLCTYRYGPARWSLHRAPAPGAAPGRA